MEWERSKLKKLNRQTVKLGAYGDVFLESHFRNFRKSVVGREGIQFATVCFVCYGLQ